MHDRYYKCGICKALNPYRDSIGKIVNDAQCKNCKNNVGPFSSSSPDATSNDVEAPGALPSSTNNDATTQQETYVN